MNKKIIKPFTELYEKSGWHDATPNSKLITSRQHFYVKGIRRPLYQRTQFFDTSDIAYSISDRLGRWHLHNIDNKPASIYNQKGSWMIGGLKLGRTWAGSEPPPAYLRGVELWKEKFPDVDTTGRWDLYYWVDLMDELGLSI